VAQVPKVAHVAPNVNRTTSREAPGSISALGWSRALTGGSGKEVPHGTRLYSIASTRYGDNYDGNTVSG